MNVLDLLTITAGIVLGLWLQTIGEKHGIVDHLLTPIPLGLACCVPAVFKYLV